MRWCLGYRLERHAKLDSDEGGLQLGEELLIDCLTGGEGRRMSPDFQVQRNSAPD